MAQVYASVTEEAAHIAGGMPEMDRTANRVLLAAKASAARHRQTGHYMSKLGIESAGNGKDRLVVADDEAAVPIEFGGLRITKRGRRVTAQRIPGLHIMGEAYKALPRA